MRADDWVNYFSIFIIFGYPNRTNVAKLFGIIPNSINSIEGYIKGLFVLYVLFYRLYKS